MMGRAHQRLRTFVRLTGTLAAAVVLMTCQRPPSDRVQGYVEGEFVYVASPFAGALEALAVRRGQQVFQPHRHKAA